MNTINVTFLKLNFALMTDTPFDFSCKVDVSTRNIVFSIGRLLVSLSNAVFSLSLTVFKNCQKNNEENPVKMAH